MRPHTSSPAGKRLVSGKPSRLFLLNKKIPHRKNSSSCRAPLLPGRIVEVGGSPGGMDRSKKVRLCPDKPGSVSALTSRAPSFIYPAGHPADQAFYPPSSAEACQASSPYDDGLHELAAPRRHGMTVTSHPVVSYTTFSPLPTRKAGGRSLLPTPTVTNSFYFRKWGALCCPDFPLAPQTMPAIEPEHSLTDGQS
jgi:hypothetical protein